MIQDAYERAIKYYATYNPEKQQFGAWLNRIIMNAIKDHLRKNKGFAEVEFDEELAEGTPCEAYTDKIVQEIRAKIASRKEHIAEILTMYFEQGYGAKDISKLVETSHVAVNQIIFRFREELKKEYKDGNSLYA